MVNVGQQRKSMMDDTAENTLDGVAKTISEAAEYLRVSSETVRRYIREGKLSAKKVNSIGLKKVWSISPTDLEEFKKKL